MTFKYFCVDGIQDAVDIDFLKVQLEPQFAKTRMTEEAWIQPNNSLHIKNILLASSSWMVRLFLLGLVMPLAML